MTTWNDYEKVKVLDRLCADHGFTVVWAEEGYKVCADEIMHTQFCKGNSLYIAKTVDEAIAWLQGLLCDHWKKALSK